MEENFFWQRALKTRSNDWMFFVGDFLNCGIGQQNTVLSQFECVLLLRLVCFRGLAIRVSNDGGMYSKGVFSIFGSLNFGAYAFLNRKNGGKMNRFSLLFFQRIFVFFVFFFTGLPILYSHSPGLGEGIAMASLFHLTFYLFIPLIWLYYCLYRIGYKESPVKFIVISLFSFFVADFLSQKIYVASRSWINLPNWVSTFFGNSTIKTDFLGWIFRYFCPISLFVTFLAKLTPIIVQCYRRKTVSVCRVCGKEFIQFADQGKKKCCSAECYDRYIPQIKETKTSE